MVAAKPEFGLSAGNFRQHGQRQDYKNNEQKVLNTASETFEQTPRFELHTIEFSRP